jgi:hypothetical protein
MNTGTLRSLLKQGWAAEPSSAAGLARLALGLVLLDLVTRALGWDAGATVLSGTAVPVVRGACGIFFIITHLSAVLFAVPLAIASAVAFVARR